MSSVAAIITTAKDIPSTDFFNTHAWFRESGVERIFISDNRLPYSVRKEKMVVTRLAYMQPRSGKHRSLSSASLRKRIMGAFIVLLTALFFALYVYSRSAYLRHSGEWSLFWVGEVITG